MAQHNNTPASVLQAPSINYEVVPGTEFTGTNRANLRRAGHYSRWLQKSLYQRIKTNNAK
jgi:hypothetical protein